MSLAQQAGALFFLILLTVGHSSDAAQFPIGSQDPNLLAIAVHDVQVKDFSRNPLENLTMPLNPTSQVENATVVSETWAPGPSNIDTVFGSVSFSTFVEVRVDGFQPSFKAETYMSTLPAPFNEHTDFWGEFTATSNADARIVDNVTLTSPGQSGLGTLSLGFVSDGFVSVRTSRSSRRAGNIWQVREISSNVQLWAETDLFAPFIVFENEVRGSELDAPDAETYIDLSTKEYDVVSPTDSVFILDIPFVYGEPFDLRMDLEMHGFIDLENFDVADSFILTSIGSFGNTVKLVSASVTNEDGVLDRNATATSLLGIQYFSLVPEPPSFALLIVAGALCFASRSGEYGRF